MMRRKLPLLFAVLAALVLLAAVFALCLGSAGLSLNEIWGGLTGDPACAAAGQILRAVRIPR
ncbi:MAG: iron ABC transporter permease, partial [Clostridia bacterium]|nr:iron ABC transporter permease [Clostridia bacterium]